MDASLLRYDEFRSFLVEAVSRVARKQYPESKSLDAVVRYVESEVKLFKRGKHSISLTEDGILLKQRAQEIINIEEKIREIII